MDTNADLEEYTIYRIIKVLYIGILNISIIVILCAGINERPIQEVDNDKSYFTCTNGNIYLFKDVQISLWSTDDPNKSLSGYDDKIARDSCLRSYELQGAIPPVNDSYTLTINTNTVGSWKTVFNIWLFGGLFFYSTLNIFKETIIYIFYGKKFTWSWLKKLSRIFFT